MREARYLCRMIGTGRPARTLSDFDEGDPFRPEIADDISTAGVDGHGWSIIDLRTHEEIRDKTGGWCLVAVRTDNATHLAIQAKYGLNVLDADTTKGQIDAKIGSESNDETFADPVDYCTRVHAKRMERARQARAST